MEREKTASGKLIEALEKAGIKGITTVFKLTAADRRRHREVEKFFRERREEEKRSREYLKKHPMYFRGFSTAAVI